MYGIDYQIQDICVEHRRSLLTLLKLQFHSFEPCYVKVPANAVRAPSSTNAQGKTAFGSSSVIKPPSFGVFSLLPRDKVDLETLFFSAEAPLLPALQLEIYHDRDELDLICAGKLPEITLQEIKPDVDDAILRKDVLMQNTSYFELFATSTVSLPLRHKCQGSFSIDAGTIELTIKLYRIDINKVHRHSYLSPFHTTPGHHQCHGPTCKVCNPTLASVEVPQLRKFLYSPPLPTPRTRREVEHDTDTSKEELNTTREDDYDSVDEFVDLFKAKHRLLSEDEDDDEEKVVTTTRHSLQLRSSVSSSISLSHIERQITLQQRQVSFHPKTATNNNTKPHSSTGTVQRKPNSNPQNTTTAKKKKKVPPPSYLAPYAISLGSARR